MRSKADPNRTDPILADVRRRVGGNTPGFCPVAIP